MPIDHAHIVRNSTNMTNSTLVLAILWAIEHGFANFGSNPLSVVQYASSNESLTYQNDLIEAALQQRQTNASSARPKLLFDDLRHMQRNRAETASVYRRHELGIWFVDSLTAFSRLERDLMNERNQYSRKGYFCLVYTGTETRELATVKHMFRRLFALYVLNVNLFIVFWGITYVYTYYPFSEYKCRSVKPALLFSVAHKNDDQAVYQPVPNAGTFFEDKIANMHRCQLAVITWNHRPYVFVNRNAIRLTSDGRVDQLLTGIEGELFMLLSAKINFTINLLVPNDCNRGLIFPNGTSTGATRMIVDGLANVTFVSYMYNKVRSKILEATISYLTVPIVLCIPRGQPMSSFERLLKPFRFIIWLCFSSTLLLAFAAILVLKLYSTARMRLFVLGERNEAPLTNLLATLFGNVMVTAMPRLNFARYLLNAWLLYTLVLRTAYTGELYMLLQDRRTRNDVKTVKQLMQLNYVFYMAPALEKLFRQMMPDLRFQLLKKDTDLNECLQRLQQDEADLVVPLLLPTVLAYNQLPENFRRSVNVLPERLITTPLTMYLRKHSYLKNRFDHLLMQLLATGIVHKMESHYLDPRRTSSTLRGSDDDEPIKLTLSLLSSLFVLYFLSVAFALFIFGLELTTRKSTRLHRFFDIANKYFR